MNYNIPLETVITIDGPAGSGKTSVAKRVASKLGYSYIDTGAMYRRIAYKIWKKGVDVNDIKTIKKILMKTKLTLKKGEFYLDNKKVKSSIIRKPVISEIASKIASYPEVRKFLIRIQRKLAEKGSVVIEGRDIGTVVFPNARFKFFLDATISERARRRYLQLRQKFNVSLNKLEKEITQRDKRDKKRKCSPLRKAKDAFYIDTTNIPLRDVVRIIINKVEID